MSKQSRLQEKQRRYQEKQRSGKKFISFSEYRDFYENDKSDKIVIDSDIDSSIPISVMNKEDD